jgi:NAD(P) transhydrogenase subunit alpha
VKIAIPKETHPDETRIPLIPPDVEKLLKRGAEVAIESGMGQALQLTDADYTKAGATVITSRQELITTADIVLRLRQPPLEEVAWLRPGTLHISYLDPFNERLLVERLAQQGVRAICMEMIPRTTLAQKMDALSSQASLAGYEAVIVAAERLKKAFPMMMTPAGTLAPARVFVIGAGVAGLQAIATAKRLGARVEAFDTRPAVAEQVRSLGAKFVEIDLGETGQTAGGYATQLTPAQLERQRQAMTAHCAQADVVITTAQVFGRRAPRIITREMLQQMRPGTIIVDMAVETGGNVEGSKVGQEVTVHEVRILGPVNLAGRAPIHASQMYSSNLRSLIEHFWDDATRSFKLDLEDEILRGCLITNDYEIRSETLRQHYAQEATQ